LALAVAALGSWQSSAFGALLPSETMRLVIPSATAILLGFHMIYGAFFMSVLAIRTTRRPLENSRVSPVPVTELAE
jgi:hypothetical protein